MRPIKQHFLLDQTLRLRQSTSRVSIMNRLHSLLVASLLALSPLLAASAATDITQIADGDSAPLTLTGAKKLVAKILADNGENQLRPGHARFDRDGNVAVEVLTTQGIAVRHVIVNTKTGGVAYAGTGAPLAKKS